VQARTVRRTITNENDENISTRLTRAKAKAATGPADAPISIIAKKPLQAKKSATNAVIGNENAIPRKRAALGDVTNGKVDAENKKLGAGKIPVVSELPKATRTTSTRSVLGTKDKNSTANELKRPASVTGQNGPAAKKRSTNSLSSRRSRTEEELDVEDNVQPLQDDDVFSVKPSQAKASTKAPGAVHARPKTEEEIRTAEMIEAMDCEDEGDPLMVSEYVYDILDYMKEAELKTMPNPNYIKQQGELQWRMRGVLVDWLLEVHTRFHLLPETFYLTVNIIDRFLSCKVVQLERLQLVGITAMFIASKYEEVLSPHVGNFRHVADDGFSEQEILSAERYILATLNYDLSFPNPMHFMRRISKADNYDIQTRTLAKYLLEITLLDHRFLAFRPSVNAAASMYLARVILEKGEWVCVVYSVSYVPPTNPIRTRSSSTTQAMSRRRSGRHSKPWSTIFRELLSTMHSTRNTLPRNFSRVS